MAETTAASAPDTEAKHERVLYTATGGRKTVFSFLFLLLLPFFISLPAMFVMRLQNGLFGDAAGHAVMAIAFGVLMVLILIELIFSLRARVELGETKVHMTLPSGRGPTPMLGYKTHNIPYDDIQAVETRREVYGGSLVPVLLQGARIITKSGEKIPLGYVSEANLDPAFPYPEIARKIAERARLPLIDRGSVRRSVRRKFLGLTSSAAAEGDAIGETQIAALNHSHKNVVTSLIGALLVLIAIGIVDDLSSDLPIGQTASALVNTAPSKSTEKGAEKAPAKPSKPAN